MSVPSSQCHVALSLRSNCSSSERHANNSPENTDDGVGCHPNSPLSQLKAIAGFAHPTLVTSVHPPQKSYKRKNRESIRDGLNREGPFQKSFGMVKVRTAPIAAWNPLRCQTRVWPKPCLPRGFPRGAEHELGLISKSWSSLPVLPGRGPSRRCLLRSWSGTLDQSD